MNRPWQKIPIKPQIDPLVNLQSLFYCLEPHPYFTLGAPYGDFNNPWMLRLGVIAQLEMAQDFLYMENSHYKLAIFDAWRPISVQKFMVEHVIKTECLARGIKSDVRDSQEYISLINEIKRFWAPPSLNPLTPPPHSTGGAIDLTLADHKGALNMGGQIDEINEKSEPDFYSNLSKNPSNSDYLIFHERRRLLKKVMTKAGFAQHPHEWWHFSFGDQLWAWLTKSNHAIYGAWSPDNNSPIL